MKITDIKTFPLKAARDIFVVKVETDEGIYGLGEGGCSSRELAEAEAVKHFSRFLIGMDPMRIEHIWQKCYRSNYHEGGRVLTGAISAIDIALWDILGKKLGVPVYQLLGGACREQVFGFPTVSMNDPDCLAKCQDYIDAGWPCLRLGAATPIPGWAKNLHAADPDADNMFEPRASIAETVEILGELRAKLDKSIPLGVEYHHRLSVAEAAAFCQQAPAGSMAFLEEPIRDETPARLRQSAPDDRRALCRRRGVVEQVAGAALHRTGADQLHPAGCLQHRRADRGHERWPAGARPTTSTSCPTIRWARSAPRPRSTCALPSTISPGSRSIRASTRVPPTSSRYNLSATAPRSRCPHDRAWASSLMRSPRPIIPIR